jgi:hypothetical protein
MLLKLSTDLVSLTTFPEPTTQFGLLIQPENKTPPSNTRARIASILKLLPSFEQILSFETKLKQNGL